MVTARTRAGAEETLGAAGRIGFAAKGALYGVVALLAIKVALGGGGRTEDKAGALEALASQPFGTALVALVASGLALYALWRLAEAARGNGEGGVGGAARRALCAGKALVYGATAWAGFSLLVRARASGSGNDEDRATATMLGLPFGRWLVLGIAAGIAAAAAFNVYRAVTLRFCDELDSGRMGRAAERSVKPIGVAAHLARAAVFALFALFLAKAAAEYDADKAVGLDGALAELARQPYGAALLGIVAAGLLAYGIFCLFEARYRRI